MAVRGLGGRWAIVLLCAGALAALVPFVFHPAGPGEEANLGFTLKDMNGADIKLSDFRGRPLIVNFWATDCGPCRLETPELVDLAAKYKDQKLQIVGISISDTPEDIRTFAKEFKVTYPLLVGAGRDEVADALGLRDAIPMSVFITAKGQVYGRLQGLAHPSYLDKQIRALF